MSGIAVGVDVSLSCTGIALADLETGRIVTHRVKAPATSSELDAVTMRNRIRRAVDGVLKWMPEHPVIFVAERPLPATSGFASLQLERAAVYWMLVDQMIPRGPVVDVHPKTRAKLATGNGNSPKADVLEAVRWDFPEATIADDNVADAVILAAAGSRWAGADLWIDRTPKQNEAYASVAWPERKEDR